MKASPMRDQLEIVTKTMEEDAKQVVLMKMYLEDQENFLSERETMADASNQFSENLRKGMSETLDETSKEVDTLIMKFYSMIHALVKEESKLIRETPSSSLKERLSSMRNTRSDETNRKLTESGERLRNRKRKNIEIEREHTVKMDRLYESMKKTFEISVERNANKLENLYDRETANAYRSSAENLVIKREEYRRNEHEARMKALEEAEKRHAESVRLAEQRVLVIIHDMENTSRGREEMLVLSHFSRLLDDVLREKREEILCEESAYYSYLTNVASTNQCVSVMKECDKILERLFAHVRKSILAEMESQDNAEIARLRQTCEEYVHTQLGNIPLDLVQNQKSLESHAREYASRMIPKLTGMVQDVKDLFEDRARRLGILYVFVFSLFVSLSLSLSPPLINTATC